ncbi:MAG: hypothetical protein ACOYOV_13980 [Bacteroidales bacterium]
MIKGSIRISQVLAELDINVLPDGKQNSFSMRFVDRKGKSVFVFRGVKTGLKMNMKELAMRGVKPVDAELNGISHVLPVWIWAITEFNGKTVRL